MKVIATDVIILSVSDRVSKNDNLEIKLTALMSSLDMPGDLSDSLINKEQRFIFGF